MKSIFLLATFVIFAFSQIAHTADSSMSKSSTTKTNLEEPLDDLDKEIKDIKLRADSGKKRRWSSSLHLDYAGGSLEDPGAAVRPRLGSDTVADPVSLSGNIGVRYRIDKNDSLFFATGFHQPRPFNDVPSDQKELEVYTPHIAYSSTFAMKGWELATGYRVYFNTLDYLREIGLVGTFGYSISALNAINTSRFRGGVSFTVYASAYDKHDDFLRPMQTDYGFGFHPSLQYNINDHANIYTSFALFNYGHSRAESDALRFNRSEVTQTIGVGYAIFRDFYVSPNLKFSPEDLRADRTTVNLSARINL